MNSNEKALDLLLQAHQTLTQEVMPSIASKDKYNFLMVANAISIVGRHFWANRGTSSPVLTSPICEEAIAKGIRAGHFDEGMPRRTDLIAILREQLTRQLAIDNPRLLDQLSQSPDRTHGHGFFY